MIQMTGFEPRYSGAGGDHAVNCATIPVKLWIPFYFLLHTYQPLTVILIRFLPKIVFKTTFCENERRNPGTDTTTKKLFVLFSDEKRLQLVPCSGMYWRLQFINQIKSYLNGSKKPIVFKPNCRKNKTPLSTESTNIFLPELHDQKRVCSVGQCKTADFNNHFFTTRGRREK